MAEEHEHRTEEEVLDEQQGVADLDLPDAQQEGVAGGSVSTGEDRPTESISLN